MLSDNVEREQLHRLLESSVQWQSETAAELNQTQVDVSKERTQYFEKLTFGCGAAIAAIVSFLGTHNEKLVPVWILRCSLISLVVAIVAALYRNLRYSDYVVAVKEWQWIEATRDTQRSNNALQHAEPPINLLSGKPIDMMKLNKEFEESDARFETILAKKSKRQDRLEREWRYAELVCLSFICIAMVSLVWLALRNF